MIGGLLSGVGKLLNAGAVCLQHVNFTQRALNCAPQELPGVLTSYARGLSDASFTGFKMTLAMMIAKEGDADRKAGLQQLMRLSDQARQGEVVVPQSQELPVSDAKDGFDQDLARVSRWYQDMDDEQRKAALIEHILSLSAENYQLFVVNLRQMQANIAENIRKHEASEANAWGGSIEDRLAYGMARLQTGQRDPVFMRQLNEYRATQAFVESLLGASELLWRKRQERDTAPAPASDAARILEAVQEFARTGQYEGGADQLQKDVTALVARGEAAEVMAVLEGMGANEGGSKTLNIADYYEPGSGLYNLRWPVKFPLPIPFEQLDRPTQFSVLFGEWSRREMEARYALLHGDTTDAMAGFEECLQRAEQIAVAELVARSHEGIASVAEKTNQRALQRKHLKLAIASRGSE